MLKKQFINNFNHKIFIICIFRSTQPSNEFSSKRKGEDVDDRCPSPQNTFLITNDTQNSIEIEEAQMHVHLHHMSNDKDSFLFVSRTLRSWKFQSVWNLSVKKRNIIFSTNQQTISNLDLSNEEIPNEANTYYWFEYYLGGDGLRTIRLLYVVKKKYLCS